MFRKSFSSSLRVLRFFHYFLLVNQKTKHTIYPACRDAQSTLVSKEARPLFELFQAKQNSVIEVCTLPGKLGLGKLQRRPSVDNLKLHQLSAEFQFREILNSVILLDC